MTKARRNDNRDWPHWLNEAWNEKPGKGALWIDPGDPERLRLYVGTLEGALHVEWNDWIVRGITGELYPVKPDIFEAIYEPAEDPKRCPRCGAEELAN